MTSDHNILFNKDFNKSFNVDILKESTPIKTSKFIQCYSTLSECTQTLTCVTNTQIGLYIMHSLDIHIT